MSSANIFTWDKLYSKIPGSKYFTWAEALLLPKVNAYANPSIDQQMNIMKLAGALDKVRDHYGKPIQITSWLRPDAYNKMIGGAPFSFHKSGAAVDFVIPGLIIELVKQDLQRRADIWPYRGEKDTSNWIHLDLGGDKWFLGYPTRSSR